MDDAQWNAWFDRRLADAMPRRFNAFAEIIVAETDLIEKRLNGEIKKLREEIAALRCDIEILTKHKAANALKLRSTNVA
jgi:hypothetical protein